MNVTHPTGFNPTTIQNLPMYQFRRFTAFSNLVHAVFTRNGGVSLKPYHSLNLSLSVQDNPTAVQVNFLTVCGALAVSPQQIAACQLIHGADIITVTHDNCRQMMGYADGLITGEPNIFLFMRFADCTPLLFFDPVQRAVGLTHAGWRGTMQNAAGATVQAMKTELGCNPENIIAAIGPAIGPCCYEVGQDVISVAQASLENASTLLKKNGKPAYAHFDMWEANRRQLLAADTGEIIQSRCCTACHTDTFFSHRAESGQTGRFGVMIGLRSVN